MTDYTDPPGRIGRTSRLDNEVERLRRSPTPTPSPFATEGSAAGGTPFYTGGFMGIFSRTRDIIAANFNEMLDKADDPSKMIRMIILEMEETLVEVRASAARTIADQKEMHRHTVKLDKLQADWGEKAQLALSKDREDLARAALVERKKFAIAVHYRLVADDQVARVESAVAAIAAEITDLRRTAAKKVFALRPRVDWDKGRAVLWLLTALGLDREDVLPLYLGDDDTDEDAFAALKGRGLGILVTEAEHPTAADYVLANTEEVGRFLGELVAILGDPTR